VGFLLWASWVVLVYLGALFAFLFKFSYLSKKEKKRCKLKESKKQYTSKNKVLKIDSEMLRSLESCILLISLHFPEVGKQLFNTPIEPFQSLSLILALISRESSIPLLPDRVDSSKNCLDNELNK
jgi:hypothetical protein